MQKRKSSLKLLAQCRKHNGPLSVDNLSLLDTLTEKEVLEEVKYLKATVAHELKMKKRITNPATGKYKMKRLPLGHLKATYPLVGYFFYSFYFISMKFCRYVHTTQIKKNPQVQVPKSIWVTVTDEFVVKTMPFSLIFKMYLLLQFLSYRLQTCSQFTPPQC